MLQCSRKEGDTMKNQFYLELCNVLNKCLPQKHLAVQGSLNAISKEGLPLYLVLTSKTSHT